MMTRILNQNRLHERGAIRGFYRPSAQIVLLALGMATLPIAGCSSFLVENPNPEAEPGVAPEAEPNPDTPEPGAEPNPNEPGTPEPGPIEPSPQPGQPEPQPDPQPGEPDPNEPDPQPGQPDPQPGEPDPQPGEPDPNEPDPQPGEPDPTPAPNPSPEPPGEVVVSPSAIDFEALKMRSGSREVISIDNDTAGAIDVVGFGLDEVSTGFILEPVAIPTTIPSGGTLNVGVYYRPASQFVIQGFRNRVHVDVAGQQRVTVELSGDVVLNHSPCLRFANANLRVTGTGAGGQATSILENCGTSELPLNDIEIFGDDELSAFVVGNNPTLIPGETVQFRVRLQPGADESLSRNAFVVQGSSDGEAGTYAVATIASGPACPDVSGSSTSTLPNESAISGTLVSGRSGDFFELNASVTAPTFPNGNRPMNWLAETPVGGSGLFVNPVDNPANGYQASGGGLHVLTVQPTREGDQPLEGCPTETVVLDVFPTDPFVFVELSWVGSPDLDLHLLKSDANNNFGEFGTEDDCHYRYKNQRNFGTPGYIYDGAMLEDDVVDGTAPERIRLAALDGGVKYKVGVRRGAGFTESTELEVLLRVGNDEQIVNAIFPVDPGPGFTTWVPFMIDDGEIVVVDEYED